MNSQQVSVVLHVSGAFESEEVTKLAQSVAGETGVRQARPSPKAPRFLLIDYDPIATSARRILDAVRSRGFSAQLIGL